MNSAFLTAQEVAEILGVSGSCAYYAPSTSMACKAPVKYMNRRDAAYDIPLPPRPLCQIDLKICE